MARRFLQSVGIAYIVFGVLGLVAVHARIPDLVIVTGLATMLLVVTPLRLTFQYGPASVAAGADTRFALMLLTVLCALSIVGGVLGFWAASTRNPAARHVWTALVAVSAVVSVWNFRFVAQFHASRWFAVLPVVWTAAYALAALRVFPLRQQSASNGV